MLLSLLCVRRRPLLSSAISLLSIALLGMAQSNLGRVHPVATLAAELENQEVEINGFVTHVSLPVLESAIAHREGQRVALETYRQIDLQTNEISCSFVSSPADGECGLATRPLGIRVGIYESADSESGYRSARDFRYGDRLRIRGRIRSPQTYGDPGVFDRRTYLLDNGIAAVMSAKAADVEALPGFGGTRLKDWRARVRRSLLQHVLALQTPEGRHLGLFSISRTDAALLAAMILGERELLDESVKQDFQRTGSYHLLVVSGMAVAIMAFAVFWLARLARCPGAIATVLSVVFVALYVSVTDLGSPVQRAALMCAVYMLARLLYRERNPLNAIGAAALAALIVDPEALFDAGFQMTFLAVLAIAGIAVPILERTTAFYRKALRQLDSTSFDLHLAPGQAQFRLDLRMLLSRLELLLPRWVARFMLPLGIRASLRAFDVIFISALMQAALALPMAVYFHRATTLALPANVVVVPVMSVLLPMAMAAALFSYVGAWVAFVPRCATALLLHGVSASVFAFAHLRASDLRVPSPPFWAGLFGVIAVAACFFCAKRRPILVICSLVLLACSDLAVIRGRKPETSAGKLEITAIDVGQGDALLVVTPQGKTLLIDGGGTLGASASGFDVGEDVVSPYLWARGFSHLDAVALSHPHGDHIGGLPAVLRNFRPRELWISPSPPVAALEALIAQADSASIEVRKRVAGDRFGFGGARFDVLAPEADAGTQVGRGNDDSMVLKISYGSTSALLEGDAERRTERAIVPELGPVTLLKVAHHGSSTSSIPPLIEAIRPQFAVISVGKFNRYGHPTREVLERMGAEGACAFRTDLNGAISFYLDGTSLAAARWGRERETMEFPSRWIPPRQAGHCAALR